jgi:hypothetical protein
MIISIRLLVKRRKFNRYELHSTNGCLDDDIFDLIGFAILKKNVKIKACNDLAEIERRIKSSDYGRCIFL